MQTGVLNHYSRFLDFVNRMFDIGIIGLALWHVHWLGNLQWNSTSTILLLMSLTFFQLSAALTGLYNSQRSFSTARHLANVVPAVLGTFALIAMVAGYSGRIHDLASRSFMLQWLALATLLLCAWRLLLRQMLVYLRRRGYNIRLVAIAGCNSTAQNLAERMEFKRWMGLVLDGVYDDEACNLGPLKGNLDDLVQGARSGRIEQVYIALPMSQEERITRLVDELADSAATVYIIPDLFTFELLNSRQTSIGGIPAISIYDSPFTVSDSLLKRSFDIVGSIGILSIIAVPMLLIAAAVKLTSPGPVIFRQRRHGLDGKPIDVWKFRTMTTLDNGAEVKQATKNDSRLTPIGGLLRRTSLDELPQFINVLQGSMSIVGPRPHAVAHNELYRQQIKGYMLRHKVKPGITGWAQINGWRGETDTLEKMEKRVEYDLDYIRNWNIWLDIKIVVLTVFKGFVDKNAY